MLRTFKQHQIRPTESLDGRWDFIAARDRKSGTDSLPRKYNRTIHVPSVWEKLPGFETYRGKAWFRKRISGHPKRTVRLVFGGVAHQATVFIDGKECGRHYDAYSMWDLVLPNLNDKHHSLVLEVSNQFGSDSALHKENDYYSYGGISRPTEIQWVPEVFIERIHAVPKIAANKWKLSIKIRLQNWTRQDLSRKLVINFNNEQWEIGNNLIKAGQSLEIETSLDALKVKPWNVKNPFLYNIQAVLYADEQPVDDLIDRVGFREVKVKGRNLLFNGKTIRLRGFNRHEDHPNFGNAIPLEAMANDLEIMRDMNANFVRTSHYPNDQRFLDMCDEMGFYVWEESHARQAPFEHPRFREQILAVTSEMIDWHMNHPSIITWGCLNECESNTAKGKKYFRDVINLIRKSDPSRPVTFASNKRKDDMCLDLVDIVSWNRYDGWYDHYGNGIQSIGPELDEMLKWLHSPKSKGGSGKPVIMSEFGAGAIYGFRCKNYDKWGEEFQAKVLDAALEVYLNHKDIAGAAIWQFCDCRVTPQWSMSRPRTMNNKGIVDEYRRPKLAYDVVKEQMKKAELKHKK